jgi:hypothetical protein
MPDQFAIEPEQATKLHSLAKVSLLSKRTHGPPIRYLADKNRYYLILAKKPKSDAERDVNENNCVRGWN